MSRPVFKRMPVPPGQHAWQVPLPLWVYSGSSRAVTSQRERRSHRPRLAKEVWASGPWYRWYIGAWCPDLLRLCLACWVCHAFPQLCTRAASCLRQSQNFFWQVAAQTIKPPGRSVLASILPASRTQKRSWITFSGCFRSASAVRIATQGCETCSKMKGHRIRSMDSGSTPYHEAAGANRTRRQPVLLRSAPNLPSVSMSPQ